MRIMYDPPSIIKNIFNDFIWDTNNDKILLTFDDGPLPGSIEIILEELGSRSIHAAFFCVGNNIKKYPDLAKNILSNGHLIANHTFNHKKVSLLRQSEIEAEIKKCNEIINDVLGIVPKYFRPPHGRFNTRLNRILKMNNMKNVMWSLLTYDFKGDLNIVKKSSKLYLKKNSVVLLHDNIKSKNIIKDSINIILDEADRQGFIIGEPEECLK